MKTLLDLTQEMLRINSETSTEADIAAGRIREKAMSDYLRDYCKSLGFDEVIQDENGNVISIIDAGAGKIINFNGHMDTKKVPADLEVRVEDERIYGRGSADMKGAIACMLDSAHCLIQRKSEFDGKVVYSFVVC